MLFKNQKMIMRFCGHRGQAAVELAIFGAIIIFVIGMILSQALSGSYFINSNLKAMRMALTESYRTSESGNPSRNTASVLLIEDRLAGTLGGKYGPIDRGPIISQGSASMSKVLFYPSDFGEANTIPVQDIIINGQRFPFVIGAYKTVTLPTTNDGSLPSCSAPHPDGRCWDTACPVSVFSPPLEDCSNFTDEPGTDPAVDCADPTCFGSWECPGGALGEDCTTAADDDADGFINCADRDCLDQPVCNADAGCVRLYTVAGNYPGSTFDPDIASRFDLDFDGVVDVPPLDRATFMWQWEPVNALYGTIDPESQKNVFVNADGGLPNGDIKEEGVKAIDGCNANFGGFAGFEGRDFSCNGFRISALHVLDNQDGDIDGTRDDRDPPPDPGLLDDAQMFSYTRDGTFLRIEEGQLFDPVDGRFVRNTTPKDHYDIAQRIFRLSNDTNRFCDAAGSPPSTVDGLPNPVEACNDCFSLTNLERTCMDEAGRLIYIRSRIQNYGGRRWITRKAPP